MKTLLELYKIAESDNIIVDSFNLPQSESVSITDENGNYFIAIDPKKVENEIDEKIKLAHELGHCESGSFYNKYSRGDIVARHENRADRRSYSTLIPFGELNKAVVSGKSEPWQLAEYFNVPEQYIRKAVQYYTEEKGLQFSKPEPEIIEDGPDNYMYRSKLKEIVFHISFSTPDRTIDDLTEKEARFILKLVQPEALEAIE